MSTVATMAPSVAACANPTRVFPSTLPSPASMSKPMAHIPAKPPSLAPLSRPPGRFVSSASTLAKAPITHASFAASIRASLRASLSSPARPSSAAARAGSMFSGLLVKAKPRSEADAPDPREVSVITAARLADEDPRDPFAAVSRKWKASVVAGTDRRRPGTHRAPLVDATGESVTRERHASGGGGDGSGRVAIGLWRADARSFAVDYSDSRVDWRREPASISRSGS